MAPIGKRWPNLRSAAGGHGLAATAARFVLGGAINTVATLLLYWLLLRVMPAHAAYAISFLTGIALSYLLNTALVFNVARAWRSLLTFPLVYLVCYLVGALVLEIATRQFRVDPFYAPLFSIAITLPLSFLLIRMVLGKRRDPD